MAFLARISVLAYYQDFRCQPLSCYRTIVIAHLNFGAEILLYFFPYIVHSRHLSSHFLPFPFPASCPIFLRRSDSPSRRKTKKRNKKRKKERQGAWRDDGVTRYQPPPFLRPTIEIHLHTLLSPTLSHRRYPKINNLNQANRQLP